MQPATRHTRVLNPYNLKPFSTPIFFSTPMFPLGAFSFYSSMFVSLLFILFYFFQTELRVLKVIVVVVVGSFFSPFFMILHAALGQYMFVIMVRLVRFFGEHRMDRMEEPTAMPLLCREQEIREEEKNSVGAFQFAI